MFSLIHSGGDGNTYKEPRYWSRFASKEVVNGLNEWDVFGYLKNWFCGLTSYPPQTDEELSMLQTVLVRALYSKEVGLGNLAHIALFAKQDGVDGVDGVAEFCKIAKGAFDILIHCVCNSPIDRLDNPIPHIQYRIFDYTWKSYYDWKKQGLMK